jgi:hypothetical protein
MAKANLAIEVDLKESFPIEEYLKDIDLFVRHKAIPTALRAASRIVVAEAKRRAPRSSKTGTAKKKSKSQQQADARRRPLADSLATKIVSKRGGEVTIAISGQKLLPHERGKRKKSETAHSHLLEFGHRGVFWKRTNWVYETKQEEGGFRYRLRADGTRESDEKRLRTVRVATLVGGQTRRDWVEAKKFLAPAVDTTKTQQHQAMIVSLEKMIAGAK